MATNLLRNEISRRRFLAISALTAGATLAAGPLLDACSTTKSGTTTLTVMTGGDYAAAIFKQYEQQNPSIKISVINYDATRLNAMFAAGQPPDLVHTDGAPIMANLMARGIPANLDSDISKSSLVKASDLEAVENGYRWNGKTTGTGSVYGLVKDWSQDGMFWYVKSPK